ncbi:MAG: hypothetical protein A2270_00025 [Elusimicrobia bacterium RIFOXYA12_FULL_51_18]|nr:MAG: hypothetical protein A2270_00025 [Elusimicrobia bacterium RIFOXYA12_FULL_51_18]OGS32353.1 MAG: hypothetical protein A2218_03075 [Elusimicrobia bacterium RIFOXYA2_FULL_53_38]
MENKNKMVLSTTLNTLAWIFLFGAGAFVSYGIYGRFAVRVKLYGPTNIWDLLIPAFWLFVVGMGFWGLKKLAKTTNK